jgi:hypothetical protein
VHGLENLKTIRRTLPWYSVCFIKALTTFAKIFGKSMMFLFKKGSAFNSILLLPYIILIRISTLISPQAYEISNRDSKLVHFIYEDIIPGALSQSILAILIVYISALLINRMVFYYKMTQNFSAIPGMFFALLISVFPDYNVLSPTMISVLCMILSVDYTLRFYNQKYPNKLIYLSGFWMGLGILFYFPLIYFCLLSSILLMVFGLFNAKYSFKHLLAWITPIYLDFGLQYYAYKSIQGSFVYYLENFGFSMNIRAVSTGEIIYLCLIAILLLSVLISYPFFSTKRALGIIKRYDSFFWLMAFSFLSLLGYKNADFQHFLILIFPVSTLTGILLLNIKNSALQEAFHFMLISLLLIFQFDIINLTIF